jgi:hypothetical protein
MTCTYSEAIAAMIFMGLPQERQSWGFSRKTLAMSLAQERWRFRMNSESSWEAGPRAVVGPRGAEGPGERGGDEEGGGSLRWRGIAEAGRASGGGLWTGGFWIHPSFFRKVVERAPYKRDFVPQERMGNQERQELDRAQELVVSG